jgi:hypothetical protein
MGKLAERNIHRYARCEQLLVEWVDPTKVEAQIAKEWGCSRRHARRFIRAVRVKWAREGDPAQVAKRRDEHRARIRSIYVEARRTKNLKIALMASERLAEIEGVSARLEAAERMAKAVSEGAQRPRRGEYIDVDAVELTADVRRLRAVGE